MGLLRALTAAALGTALLQGQPSLWSLAPIRRPEPPVVRAREWVRNPIDAFVLARLEKEGVAPSPAAPRHVLLRRLYLDLTGLPPSPREQDAFLSDRRPDAYERLVEQLLASDHYGEKWARQWLDLARFADSDGFRQDKFRPWAWRYRQWVIDAFNRDMPFDRFTIEQIAGDLLPSATVEQRVATGFHRNTLTNREGGIDSEQFRVEQVIDRTSTVGTVWLGLTVGCAQCHDHKYDPISQKDFYRLFAFFNSADEVNIDAPLEGEMGPHLKALPEFQAKRDKLVEQYGVPPLQRDWELRMVAAVANPGKWPDWDHAFDDLRTEFDDGLKILQMDPAARTRRQKKALTDYFLGNYGRVITKERKEELKFGELQKQLRELDATLPELTQAGTLAPSPKPRATHVLLRGDFRQPGQEVSPGTPAVLPNTGLGETPNRLDLARWLVSRANPLTARVTVNRLWQEYFGRGLVVTSENFGNQGEKPSHPELLDWLASEFLDHRWSLKHVHRLIVTSNAYRQSSNSRPDLESRDPQNTLLARQSRFRLPAELIRDSTLAASGLLHPAVGGPSVRPPEPAGATSGTNVAGRWAETQGPERYRRGMYIQLFRTAPYPLLLNFDAPNAYRPVCRRTRSNTPLQALNLLNDPVFLEAAQALAVRVITEAPPSFGKRLQLAYRLCLARAPDAAEEESLLGYLQKQQRLLAEDPAVVGKFFPPALSGGKPSVEAAAWVGLSSVLLNLDEFLTRE
ncbi:MAG: DUF1549 and DUF1553 domain-containing protein [Bryobacteraceae bacterium]